MKLFLWILLGFVNSDWVGAFSGSRFASSRISPHFFLLSHLTCLLLDCFLSLEVYAFNFYSSFL